MRLTLVALLFAALPVAGQEATIPERYQPGDVSHFAFEIGGTRIGRTWSRYEGALELAEQQGHRFLAQTSMTQKVPGGELEQRFSAELVADPNGHPVQVDFRFAMEDVYAAIDISFADQKAQAVVTQGVSKRTLDYDVPADVYLLANNFIPHLELVLSLDPPAPGETGSYSFFSANVLQVVPVTIEYVGEDASGVHYRDSLGEELTMRAGRLQELQVPSQGLVVRRVDEALEPFTIEDPAKGKLPPMAGLEREDVIIDYDEVSLAGSVTRPEGASGKLPAVFFVSGSGGQDRNGFASGIDVGTHQILDRLTREGFLVLRVDDRGVGESTGPTEGTTFDDLVEDARRCVAYLQSREDVDPARVVVIGHSEGGQTAPILAPELDLAAIVLMAAPGRSVLALSREQFLRGKRLQGASEEEVEAFGQAIDSFFAKVIADEPIDANAVPPELAPFVSARAWLKSHAAQDPLANLERVTCPVLVLQGGKDIQVLADRDAPLLEGALEASGNPDFELVLFPDLDHLFKRSEEEVPTGAEYLQDRPVDPAFLETLTGWLGPRLLADDGGR